MHQGGGEHGKEDRPTTLRDHKEMNPSKIFEQAICAMLRKAELGAGRPLATVAIVAV